MEEKELEQILGGAPKEAAQEFAKPGQLSEEELMGVLAGGANRDVMVETQLPSESVFRQSAVEKEKAAMFQELEQASQQETTSQHRM